MSTVLHLPFDVEAGYPAIVDHSQCRAGLAAATHDYTSGYYAKVVDSAGKYGGALALKYGYLTAPYDSTWMDLQGDWTVEGWLNSPLNTGTYMAIIGRWADNSGPWRFSITSAGHLFLDYLDSAGSTNPTSGATSTVFVQVNTWTHFAFVRSGTTMSVYVNGVLDYTQTIASIKINTSPVLTIGRSQQSTTWYLPGYIDDLRVSDTALYTAAFTPPDKISYTALTSILAADRSDLIEKSYYPSPVWSTGLAGRFARMIGRLSDVYYGGTGTIEGHTYVMSGGTKQPVARRVRLFVQPHYGAVAETWSDSTTGYYSFGKLSTDYKYTVVSFDHTGANESVVGSNITPV